MDSGSLLNKLTSPLKRVVSSPSSQSSDNNNNNNNNNNHNATSESTSHSIPNSESNTAIPLEMTAIRHRHIKDSTSAFLQQKFPSLLTKGSGSNGDQIYILECKFSSFHNYNYKNISSTYWMMEEKF